MHCRTLAAILALVAPAAARAGADALRPIAWLEPSALAKPFLQLAFEAPETVPPGAFEISLRTYYSNTILQGWGPSLMVNVQVETAQPTAVLRYGVAPSTELQIVVPGAIDYAGWLARPIKVVEGFFARVNPLRVGPPPRQARIQIERYRDGTGLDWVGEDAAVGDLSLGVKTLLRSQDGLRPALALRAALGLPTGRFPDGTGAVALAAGVSAGWTRGATALWAEADGALPSRTFSSMRLPARAHGAFQLGIARRLGASLSVHLQGSAHTAALARTGIPVVDGSTFYLLGGVTVAATRALSVSVAVVENVFATTRGADITGVLDMTWRR